MDDVEDAERVFRAARPVEQPHAAVGADQAVLDRHFAGADVLPPHQVLAIKQLLPFSRLGLRRWNRPCHERSRNHNDQCQMKSHYLHLSSREKYTPNRCAEGTR